MRLKHTQGKLEPGGNRAAILRFAGATANHRAESVGSGAQFIYMINWRSALAVL